HGGDAIAIIDRLRDELGASGAEPDDRRIHARREAGAERLAAADAGGKRQRRVDREGRLLAVHAQVIDELFLVHVLSAVGRPGLGELARAVHELEPGDGGVLAFSAAEVDAEERLERPLHSAWF